MVDSEIPSSAREETWIAVVKDLAVGAAAGLALALFWVIIGIISGSDGGGLW